MAVDPSKLPKPGATRVPEYVREQPTGELPDADPNAEGPDHLKWMGEGNAIRGLIQTNLDYRKSGSSAQAGIGPERRAQEMAQAREANASGFFHESRKVLDQLWMDDVTRGPFSGKEETKIGILGNEINLGDTSLPKDVYQNTVGAGAEKAGDAGQWLLDTIDDITHWVNVRAGYGVNQAAHWAGNDFFDPMSLSEYEASGLSAGKSLLLTGLAGSVIDDTEFGSEQARWEAQQKDMFRQIMTGKKLEQAGFGSFDAWWAANEDQLGSQGLDQIIVPDGFKLRDAKDWQQLVAYQDEMANTMTGAELEGRAFGGDLLTDFLIPVGPLRAPKWLRYGTKMKNGKQLFAGVSNKSTLNAKVHAAHADAVDDFVLNGTKNAAAKEAEAVAAGGYGEIMAILSPKRGATGTAASHMVASVLKDVTDSRQAAVVLAAVRGSVKHRKMLHDDYTLLYDAIARGNSALKKGVTTQEAVQLARPTGFSFKPLVARNFDGVDEIALTDDAIRAAEEQLGLLRNELYLLDDVGQFGLTNIGSTNAWAKGVANAWRMGKANRDSTPTLLGRAVDKAKGAKGPVARNGDLGAYAERTPFATEPKLVTLADGQKVYKSTSGIEEMSFRLSSNFRQVKVWKWINGQRGTGYLKIRGDDAYQGADEIAASLTDSKIIKNDPQFIQEMKNVWASALTPDERMRAAAKIERASVERIIREYPDMDYDSAMKLYEHITKRRSELMGRLTNVDEGRAYGFDPETGDLILAHPTLVSQLDTSLPLLDMRIFEKTIARANNPVYKKMWSSGGQTFERSQAMMGTFFDEVNSLWKANVLLRLGYTQRNVLEGWMRSWAYLGAIPALNPDNMIRGAWRLGVGNRYRDVVRGVSKYSTKKIARQIDERKALRALDKKDLEVTRMELASSMTRQRKSVLLRHEKQLMEQIKVHDNAIAAMQEKGSMWASRRANAKRRRMYDEEGEAFAGRWGDLRRESAGAGDTVENFLQSRAGRARDWERLHAEDDWAKIMPSDDNYFIALKRAGDQFAADDLARMALEGKSREQMIAWLHSRRGEAHLRRLEVNGYKPTAEKLADRTFRMVNDYLPTEGSRKLFLQKVAPTEDELQVALAGLKRGTLSPVHGNAMRNWFEVEDKVRSLSNSVRQGIFKWLGSKPESFLVRHPFYAEVYRRQVDDMVALYRKQGTLIDDDMIALIEKSAHADALKATDDIMFTILRYSNPANATKFLSPFFAAWENSMRVWGRIVAKSPYTAYAGALLWDMPNRFGMVYTYEGKPIESDPSSFFRGTAASEEGYIYFPQPWREEMAEWFGGVVPAIPKSAINVVSPGEVPWLPGFGPSVLIPAAQILSWKPDWQIELKRTLGDQFYSQIAPFGVADEPERYDLLSSWQRRGIQGFLGESDDAYMGVALGVMKNMITSHMVSGAPASEFPTMDDYRQKTNNWFLFSMIAGATLPVAVTRMSEYQLEIQTWNNLKRVLPFDQALDRFEAQFGPEMIPLIVSGSKRNVKSLDYTEQAFNDIRQGKQFIEDFSTQGKSFAGVLAAASGRGDFEVGVYHYLHENEDVATGDLYIERFTMTEMEQQIEMQVAWNAYRKQRASYDTYVANGVLSKSEASSALKQWSRDPEGEIMSSLSEGGRTQWLAALETFEDAKPAEMGMIARAVQDHGFRNSDIGSRHVWDEIEYYLTERKRYQDMKAAGLLDSAEAQGAFDTWREDFRYTSLAFSDFFDVYFANDDLNTDIIFDPDWRTNG